METVNLLFSYAEDTHAVNDMLIELAAGDGSRAWAVICAIYYSGLIPFSSD